MKRILIYILLPLFGIIVGYLLNDLFQTPNKNQKRERIYVDKIKKKIIKDTVFIKKEVYIPSKNDTIDTKTTIKNDTAIDSTLMNNRNITNEELREDGTNEVIISEKKLDQRIVFLDPSPIDSNDVESLLGVESDAFSNEIIIEFWQSPLDLTGYVLTRNKLKLFGFNPDENFTLQLSKDKEHLFLNTETLSILLEKTEQFKNLTLK